ATVRMRERGTKEDELFKLVGEATGSVAGDVFEVTASSPMGEAMMKARVGETITVRTPRGSTRFEIMEIL
ncbi:MAG: GreA/GreB family elongation factor, partial [bacterium]